MSEKRFEFYSDEDLIGVLDTVTGRTFNSFEIVDVLNEQQELIEELQVSDEMGWKRAEHFEKKCPKELHNKNMYIKRLEYKVQKFKEENEQLRLELETHKHPLWSTREAERKVDKLKKENEDLKQQLVDVTKSIDSLCNRVDKSNRSNEFKWGAIMGLRTLQRELKGDE